MESLTHASVQLPPFVLASGSPQRKWILQQLGLRFTLDSPDIDESLDRLALQRPHAIVKHLAWAKAKAVAPRHPKCPILGADTLVVNSRGQILGKPRSRGEAQSMLDSYNGAHADVYSGVAWLTPDPCVSWLGYEKTRLFFNPLSPETLQVYLDEETWKDCSGGVKVETIAPWIKKREGSYWNVVGLPVGALQKIALSYKG